MTEPRWLTDEEQRVWRSFSAAISMLRGHVETQLQQESGMPHTYYEVLVALSEAPDRTLRMSDLADVSRSSRSRLSHAVSRLEANGWVKRYSCATDKRGAWASLTPAGFAALEAAAPGHVEAVRQSLFDPLTPDQVRALGEISDAIVGKLAAPCAAAKAREARELAEDPCAAEPCAEESPVLSGEPKAGASGVSG
ncbi:MarR family winged helix-turn-helix transcriptional regulator [Amycolatopsis sp. YIM 10]|uniref:MarR family winged helix-turn-helix transcriptional regulator n=1 Tax=Amycolatopsis sp. YIM 10 TaxID=2653857 RepID=UPI00128FF90B|nr:MarR family transcriptional regulator [Amycolatopsis sp. YIM 10]QFU88646.1 transcriptional repressor MprA [Amycolatopsis sp. YIM 10]